MKKKIETYHIQRIIRNLNKYSDKTMVIKTKNFEFFINLSTHNFIHLMGLQYMFKKKAHGNSWLILHYIFKYNLSDDKIYEMKNSNIHRYGIKSIALIKNSIHSLEYFIYNIHKLRLVDRTLISSSFLKSNKFLLMTNKKGTNMTLGLIVSKDGVNNNLETYIVSYRDSHFKNSELDELVEEVYFIEKENDDFCYFT